MACSVHHTPVLFNNWSISQYLETFNHIGYAQYQLITDIHLCKISVVYDTQCAFYWQCFRTTLVYHDFKVFFYLMLDVFFSNGHSVNPVHFSNMNRDFYQSVYTIFNRIKLTIWTICAFRVMNPNQWSLAKQISIKSWKVKPKTCQNKLKPKGMVR